MQIRGSKNILRPTKADGTVNGVFNEALWALLRGGKVTLNGSAEEATIDVDGATELSIANVEQIVAGGGEVYGYPVWVELSSADFKKPVPDGTPGGKDAEGSTHTWEGWAKGNSITEDGSKKYIGSNAGTGSEFKGSEIVALKGKGVKLKTLKEMQDIVAAKSALNEKPK